MSLGSHDCSGDREPGRELFDCCPFITNAAYFSQRGVFMEGGQTFRDGDNSVFVSPACERILWVWGTRSRKACKIE